MDANDMQIGGNHYRMKYIHWDFVCDTNMPYLLGCATKCLTRWQSKGGVVDLRKSLHYLRKADELEIYMPENKWWEKPIFDIFGRPTTEQRIRYYTIHFIVQLPAPEANIIRLIVGGHYDMAENKLDLLIEEELSKPCSGYTNQDPTYFRG